MDKLRGKGTYKYGYEVGEWMRYDYNGQISSKTTFIAGVMHGEYISYYKNGQLEG